MIFAGFGVRYIFVAEYFWAAEFMDANSLHRCPSLGNQTNMTFKGIP
jgi:hypothetical protein